MTDSTILLDEPKRARRKETTSTDRAPVTEDIAAEAAALSRGRIDDLDEVADWLDSRYRIPGTSIRFGWDSILGLIPGIGDTAALIPAVWLIISGYNRGAETGTLVRMSVNTALDYFIGGIPVIGDIFDLFFKANRRNIALLKADLGRPGDA